MSTTVLPVADGRHVGRYVMSLAKRYPRLVWGAAALHIAAALAALAAPRLLGDLVEDVQQGTTVGAIDRTILLLAGFLLLQTVLTRYARFVSFITGERVLAELREDFVENTLALPVGIVESAGSGDLLTRTSRDVEQLGWSVRWALPEWLIAVITAILTFTAALLVGWWVLIPCALGVPPLVVGLRWYLAPREGRLPARERVLLGDERLPHRDRRGRPHRRGARPGRPAPGPDRPRHLRLLLRRALHAVPAHGVLPLRRGRLPDPDGRHPAVRRLALHPGLGVARRRDRGRALRADAHRPGGPHRQHPRRAAGRRRVAGPAARRRRRARRPGRHRAGADGREDRRRGRAVLLRRRPRRAARRRPVRRGRRTHRHGRPVRRRQVDARPAAGGHPPAAHRFGDRGRRRAHRAAADGPARARRAGDPGAPRLRRHDQGQPRARRRREGLGRPAPRRAGRGRRPRVGRGAARRARHGGRLGRSQPHSRRRPSRSRSPAWCWPTRTRWCSTRRPR